jgi:hypothetical protein
MPFVVRLDWDQEEIGMTRGIFGILGLGATALFWAGCDGFGSCGGAEMDTYAIRGRDTLVTSIGKDTLKADFGLKGLSQNVARPIVLISRGEGMGDTFEMIVSAHGKGFHPSHVVWLDSGTFHDTLWVRASGRSVSPPAKAMRITGLAKASCEIDYPRFLIDTIRVRMDVEKEIELIGLSRPY